MKYRSFAWLSSMTFREFELDRQQRDGNSKHGITEQDHPFELKLFPCIPECFAHAIGVLLPLTILSTHSRPGPAIALIAHLNFEAAKV